MSSSSDTPTLESSDDAWLCYERSVGEMLAALDSNASVSHNVKVPGRISGAKRQVDVWVLGSIAAIDLTIAVECKRRLRRTNIEMIDQFVGKLLDIGADRGVLYSYSGFTTRAVARAAAARNPGIMVVTLDKFASTRPSAGDPRISLPSDRYTERLPVDHFDGADEEDVAIEEAWPEPVLEEAPANEPEEPDEGLAPLGPSTRAPVHATGSPRVPVQRYAACQPEELATPDFEAWLITQQWVGLSSDVNGVMPWWHSR